jgi:multidrug efflux system membrane fusion protein
MDSTLTNRRKASWIRGALGVLISACEALAVAADGAPASAPAPVPVGVGKVQRQDVPVYVGGLGTVQAYRTVSIHPQVDGQLIKVSFKEGQEVRAGDVLGQIDPRAYQAALDQALAKKAQNEALLANALLDVQRYAGLVEKNYIARQQLDTTRAQVAQLEAAVKGDEAAAAAARIQLGYTDIRSPIAGRVGLRQIDAGNIVHGGGGPSSPGSSPEVLAVVTQLRPINVVFTMPQKELPHLLQGQGRKPLPVSVLSKEDGQPLDQGTLEVIDNQVDAATGSVRLKAVLPNARGLLWPGQQVNTRLLLSVRSGALTVPAPAVQSGATGPFVYVVKGDASTEVRPVTLGPVDETHAVVVKGLEAGETVVTSGHYRLKPGVKVQSNPRASSTPL